MAGSSDLSTLGAASLAPAISPPLWLLAELARKLGVSRKCLWERRQRLGIPRRKTGVASET